VIYTTPWIIGTISVPACKVCVLLRHSPNLGISTLIKWTEWAGLDSFRTFFPPSESSINPAGQARPTSAARPELSVCCVCALLR
jgi:hypothetical protein